MYEYAIVSTVYVYNITMFHVDAMFMFRAKSEKTSKYGTQMIMLPDGTTK